MKTKIFLPLAVAFALVFSQCKKDDDTNLQPKGDYATNSTVNANLAKNYDFSITFSPSSTMGSYSLPSSSVSSNDAVIVYWKEQGYTDMYIQTPYIWYETPSTVGVNFWAEYDNIITMLYVHATRADGSSASPWATNSTQNFRAVVIKGARYAHPAVNYNNYEEVKKVFNLKD